MTTCSSGPLLSGPKSGHFDLITIRINFGYIRASVATPVKVFIFFDNYSVDPVVKASHSQW